MKIGKSAVVLLCAPGGERATSMADAGQSRHRYHRYANPDYPRGYYGWRGLRLFGFGYGSGATSCCARR